MYNITLSEEAKKGLSTLRHSEPSAFKKAMKLLDELVDHPTMGTGHPHQLTGNRAGQWSQSITKKHRLVYSINNAVIEVFVISAYGHYDDK